MGRPALRPASACHIRDAGPAIGQNREREAPSLHPGRWVGPQSVPIFRQEVYRGTRMGRYQAAQRARCDGGLAERTGRSPRRNSLTNRANVEETKMTTSVKQMLEAANEGEPRCDRDA